MATRKRGSREERKAPRGNAEGVAAIRMWTNALETAMLARYIGNKPTLRPLRQIVKATLREIGKIKPKMMSDCPDTLSHQPNCFCNDPEF